MHISLEELYLKSKQQLIVTEIAKSWRPPPAQREHFLSCSSQIQIDFIIPHGEISPALHNNTTT